MSQVKRHFNRYSLYIEAAALVLLIGGLFYVGFYLYTGKGWLLLERKETLSDFYYNRGLHYFGGGAYNLSIARQSFEEALAHANGHYPFAHLELGRTYFIVGDFSSALIAADAELANYPDHNRAHYVKGLIYGFRKQYIEAEEEFKAYISNEAYPTWAPYNDLSWIYFSEGDYENAAKTALAGMQHTIESPFAAWLENSYAVAEMNLGNYAAAGKFFSLAQRDFMLMTPEQWGISYSGNDPNAYTQGLAQARAAVDKNLLLVHTKLGQQ